VESVRTPIEFRGSRGWVPLAGAALCVATYAVIFVLPYFVNGLDRFSLQQVASGAHDPKQLWPINGLGYVAFLWQLAGYATLAFAPLVATLAGAWSLVTLCIDSHRLDVTGRVARLSTVALSAALLLTLWSPFGLALKTWFMD
jgi:hypothetical protein